MRSPESAGRFQEQLYSFPYHLIPAWDGRHFSQVLSLHWGYEYLSYLHFVLDRLSELEFDSLLDVGCGDGRLLRELRPRHPQARLAGIDRSSRAIQWARGGDAEVDWIHGDITDDEVLPERFDVVTLIETLEHIPVEQLPGFLEGIRRRLRRGGILLLTVPTTNVPVSLHHVQHFDLAALRGLLGGTFTIERVEYLNQDVPALRWFSRAVLHNALFVVTEKHLLSYLYRLYVRRFLRATETSGRRLLLVCRNDLAEQGAGGLHGEGLRSRAVENGNQEPHRGAVAPRLQGGTLRRGEPGADAGRGRTGAR